MEKNVLVIGDTHIPFEHPGYLNFCKRIKKAYKCTEVVHIGDLVDNHAISYHEHDPDGMSPKEEMDEADRHLKHWFKAFPKLKLCIGNHDRLVARKTRSAGIPSRAYKPFHELWNLPSGWEVDFEFVIDGVKYLHGTGESGKYGHTRARDSAYMSCVIGHLHSVSGVEYVATNQIVLFGMAVGCGIHRKAYTFKYGKDFKRKPILSCGVVNYNKHGVIGKVIPMQI